MGPTHAIEQPLAALLAGVLAGVRRDIPGALGTAVSTAQTVANRGAGHLRVLFATGVGEVIVPITTGHLWGPALLSAATEEPIVTADLWRDSRWPHLTLDAVLPSIPAEHRAAVAGVCGAAAVPGIWQETGVVILSAYLDRPADQRTVAELVRHEPLVASAVTVVEVATRNEDRAEGVLAALASRAVIEQAKGTIMAVRRCDANQAWHILRRASQRFNIKLRELSLALVEHVGQSPAQQSEDSHHRLTASPAARTAADLVWRALCTPTRTASLTHPDS